MAYGLAWALLAGICALAETPAGVGYGEAARGRAASEIDSSVTLLVVATDAQARALLVGAAETWRAATKVIVVACDDAPSASIGGGGEPDAAALIRAVAPAALVLVRLRPCAEAAAALNLALELAVAPPPSPRAELRPPGVPQSPLRTQWAVMLARPASLPPTALADALAVAHAVGGRRGAARATAALSAVAPAALCVAPIAELRDAGGLDERFGHADGGLGAAALALSVRLWGDDIARDEMRSRAPEPPPLPPRAAELGGGGERCGFERASSSASSRNASRRPCAPCADASRLHLRLLAPADALVAATAAVAAVARGEVSGREYDETDALGALAPLGAAVAGAAASETRSEWPCAADSAELAVEAAALWHLARELPAAAARADATARDGGEGARARPQPRAAWRCARAAPANVSRDCARATPPATPWRQALGAARWHGARVAALGAILCEWVGAGAERARAAAVAAACSAAAAAEPGALLALTPRTWLVALRFAHRAVAARAAGGLRAIALEVRHGLSNRLRAAASALALGALDGRNVLVEWVPDVHCDARLGELFSLPALGGGAGGVPTGDDGGDDDARARAARGPTRARRGPAALWILDQHVPGLFPTAAGHWAHFNYIEVAGGEADARLYARIDDAALPRIHVRSAHLLNLASADLRALGARPRLSAALRAFAPVPSVVRLVDAAAAAFAAPARGRNPSAPRPLVVGVHVRMETNMTADVPGIAGARGESRAEAMADVGPARGRCHVAVFVRKVARLCRLHAGSHGDGAHGALSALGQWAKPDALATSPAPGAARESRRGRPCRLYVASDSIEAHRAMRAAFGGSGKKPSHLLLDFASATGLDAAATVLPCVRGERRRGARCQRLALAEQLVLARSDFLLTSDYSSFSDLALLWAGDRLAYAPDRGARHRSGCRRPPKFALARLGNAPPPALEDASSRFARAAALAPRAGLLLCSAVGVASEAARAFAAAAEAAALAAGAAVLADRASALASDALLRVALVESPFDRLARAYALGFAARAGTRDYYAAVARLLRAPVGASHVVLPSGERVRVAAPPACAAAAAAAAASDGCVPWSAEPDDVDGGFFAHAQRRMREQHGARAAAAGAGELSLRERVSLAARLPERLSFDAFVRALARASDAELPARWASQTASCALSGGVRFDFVGAVESLHHDGVHLVQLLAAKRDPNGTLALNLPRFEPFTDDAVRAYAADAADRGLANATTRAERARPALPAPRLRGRAAPATERVSDLLWTPPLALFAKRTVLADDLRHLARAGYEYAYGTRAPSGAEPALRRTRTASADGRHEFTF